MRPSALAGLLTALLVLSAPAGAAARDRDHDRLPDRWEKRHGLSSKAMSAAADPDRDRVDNLNEHREGTHPRDRDSDDDGRPDGREDSDRDKLDNAAEDQTGNDPRDRDSDDDGVGDGREQAGVVASFDGAQLVISLARGGSVTGLVDEDTELLCQSEEEAEADWAKSARGRTAGLFSDDGDPEDEDEFGDDAEEEDDSAEGDEDEFGDEDEEDMDEEADEDACPADRLEAGARVHEAELDIDSDGAYFIAVELLL